MKKNRKATASVVIVTVIVIAAALFGGYKYLWWFTPAYSQRQTIQHFFADVNRGKDSTAYKFTTSSFQSKNSYAAFQANLAKLSGDKLSISYKQYSKRSGGDTLISGDINDKTTAQTTSFVISVVDNKIDTLTALTF